MRDESSECTNSVEVGGKSSSGMRRIKFSAERGLHRCHRLIIIHHQHNDGHTVSDQCEVRTGAVLSLRLLDGLR